MARYLFPISRAARERYALSEDLFSSTGNVVFLDLHAARLFTQRINTARSAAADPREALRAGDMNAMGLIDEILHYVVGLYRKQIDPRVFTQALDFAERSLGKKAVKATLARFVQEFPPPSKPQPETILEELLLLSLANTNPAFSPFVELFDHTGLPRRPPTPPS